MPEGINEEVIEDQSDKEKNFQALREKTEALEARLAELEPLAKEKAIRNAGFDPDAPGAGKALLRLVPADADADTVKSLAEELGFETPKPGATRTPEQRVIEEQSQIQQRLQSVTTSDEPQDLPQAIADAEAAGDWMLALRLKNQLVYSQARG